MPHQGDVRSVALSPNGKTIVTGSRDNKARLWDAASSQPVGPPFQHAAGFSLCGQARPTPPSSYRERPIGIGSHRVGNVVSVAFSPDGKTVLTGRPAYGAIARLWETPAQIPDDPPRLAAWVQTLTGMELDEQGVAHLLDPVGWRECRGLLR